jgi:hypothetical protein
MFFSRRRIVVPKACKEGRNIGLKPMQFAIFWMSINPLVLLNFIPHQQESVQEGSTDQMAFH